MHTHHTRRGAPSPHRVQELDVPRYGFLHRVCGQAQGGRAASGVDAEDPARDGQGTVRA
jgi:hypothetical protein